MRCPRARRWRTCRARPRGRPRRRRRGDACGSCAGEREPPRSRGVAAAVGRASPTPAAAEPAALGGASWSATRASWCCPSGARRAQLALREAKVLVVGAGALGSPVAAYLAGAGVGRLGIVDGDAVELSDLHRQHLHFTPDVGVPKAHSAAAKLALPQPGGRRRALPGAPRREQRGRARRGPRPRRRLHATPSRPATRSTPPAARPATRWWRAAWWARPGMVMAIRPGGERVLPLRVPRAAGRRAELRRGRRARPGGGRHRLAAGARGDQAAERGGGAAAGRVPAGRPRRPARRSLRVAGDAPPRLPGLRRLRSLTRSMLGLGTVRRVAARCAATSPPPVPAIPRPPACRRRRSSPPGPACTRCSPTASRTRSGARACPSRRARSPTPRAR